MEYFPYLRLRISMSSLFWKTMKDKMLTIFLYMVLLFLFSLLPKSVSLDFFPLYDKYLLHFIYENEEEDLLKIATIDYKNEIKKSYLLTCNVIPIMKWEKTKHNFHLKITKKKRQKFIEIGHYPRCIEHTYNTCYMMGSRFNTF
jgi:hypothetical protein